MSSARPTPYVRCILAHSTPRYALQRDKSQRARYPHRRLSALNMSARFISAPAFSRAKNVLANLGSRDQFPREHLRAMNSVVLSMKAGKQGGDKGIKCAERSVVRCTSRAEMHS